jgi:hypothetical protein
MIGYWRIHLPEANSCGILKKLWHANNNSDVLFPMEYMARILSLTLVVFYLLIAYALDRIGSVHRMIPLFVFGVACIWYGDSLGGMTGFRWFGTINISRTTPGGFVRFLGWLLLLLPLIFLVT